MKTFQLILTVMLLFGLTTAMFAQNDVDAVRRQVLNDVEKRFQRFDLLNGINARLLVAQGITASEAFCEELGLSQDEAIELSQRVMTDTHPILMNENPVYKSLHEERTKLMPFHPDATEETVEKYTALWMQMNEMEQNKMIEHLHETYSPDQMKKINEFLIANMYETEHVFPGMFEIFDLSDEQKKQLDEITKELEPELEKHIDEIVEYYSKQQETIQEKLKAIADPEERNRLRNDFIQKTLADLKPERDKMMLSGKKLTNNLKVKMFDVLSDEQWKRMLKLIDDPPEYIKKTITQQRKNREELERINGKPEAWAPGPNSWKPGDPIPEGYRQQRSKRRFPGTDNQSE